MRLMRLLLVMVVAGALLALSADAAFASPTVIVLDPGHSGTDVTTIDPETRIRDEEYPNIPEITNVFDVALRLKAKLEAAGYTVLLTKQNAMDTVSKRERADVANDSQAALGVSIHTSVLAFRDYGEIYVQTLNSFRENEYGQKIYFADPRVAALSAQYGLKFLEERRKIEGPKVRVAVNTQWEVRGLAPGNIPIVQLFSKVPWILSEAGIPSNSADREAYAQGLFNSIVACVPAEGTSADPSTPVTRFEQTDERIVKKGTWETFSKTNASSGDYGRSASADASATIRFTGTRLDIIGMTGTTTGIADIYFDGEFQETIDLASALANYRVKIWSTGEVANGLHTVELVRNQRTAAGKFITLDAVDITGALTPPMPTVESVNPGEGASGGGTAVTLTGTGLIGVTAVTFGGVPATVTRVDSGLQQIALIAPPGPPGAVQVQVSAAGGKTQDTVTDDFVYGAAPVSTRHQQEDGHIVKAGSWSDFLAAKASGGSYGRSSTAGASVTICFAGTRLDWVGMKGTTTGIAEVYVDGLKKGTIDLAAATPVYDVTVWSTGTLANGEHTVRIVRSASSAAGKFLTVDAVDIWGTICDPPNRYEQTDTRIVKMGAWTTFLKSAASGGSYGRSNTNSPPLPVAASATIYFTGTRLDWVAMKGTTTGTASVYLDGDRVASVPLGAPVATYKVVVWSTGTLPYGDHKVVIERAERTGSLYVTLDAVEIWGTIKTAP